MKKLLYLGFSVAILASCQDGQEQADKHMNDEDHQPMMEGEGHHKHGHGHHHGEANKHMHASDFNDLVDHFESKERDEYQEPEKVLKFIGDIHGLTVMDLGAGSGYFSFRFADAGANVIAADVNQQFQDYIKKKRDSLNIDPGKLALRKVAYDDPMLAEQEVDKVVIVNTYHHIEDRVNYFSKVKKGLKRGGELFVIDFVKEEVPYGPPVEMKLTADEVAKELKKAGFSQVLVNDKLLKYQYIIRAR